MKCKRPKGRSRQDFEEAKLDLLRKEVEAKESFLHDLAKTEIKKVQLLEKLVQNPLRVNIMYTATGG